MPRSARGTRRAKAAAAVDRNAGPLYQPQYRLALSPGERSLGLRYSAGAIDIRGKCRLCSEISQSTPAIFLSPQSPALSLVSAFPRAGAKSGYSHPTNPGHVRVAPRLISRFRPALSKTRPRFTLSDQACYSVHEIFSTLRSPRAGWRSFARNHKIQAPETRYKYRACFVRALLCPVPSVSALGIDFSPTPLRLGNPKKQPQTQESTGQ